MGLLLGALSGLGQGMVQNADVAQAQQNKVDLANLEEQLAEQKEQFTLSATTAQQAQQRAAMGQQVGAAQTGLLNQATIQNAQSDMAQKQAVQNAQQFYSANSPSGTETPQAYEDLSQDERQQFAPTADQKAAIAQQSQNLSTDQQSRYAPDQEQKNQAQLNALSQTGYLSPEGQATMLTSQNKLQTQMLINANTMDIKMAMQQLRSDVTTQDAQARTQMLLQVGMGHDDARVMAASMLAVARGANGTSPPAVMKQLEAMGYSKADAESLAFNAKTKDPTALAVQFASSVAMGGMPRTVDADGKSRAMTMQELMAQSIGSVNQAAQSLSAVKNLTPISADPFGIGQGGTGGAMPGSFLSGDTGESTAPTAAPSGAGWGGRQIR